MVLRILLLMSSLFLITACKDDGSSADRSSGTTRLDQTADKIYDDLMTRILSGKLTKVSNGSSARAGDFNPYRKHSFGYQHKALAVCVNWDVDKLKVNYLSSNSTRTNDWDWARVAARQNCNQNKTQKDLNCRCQIIDHDDENVLWIPTDFRTAYENKNSSAKSSQQNNERRYFLDVSWENILQYKQLYSVMVKQIGRSGYVKSASLIGGRTCDAVFNFQKDGSGDWEVDCTDGTNAVGVMQAQGPSKGSKGSGYDKAGNKISFSMSPATSVN